MVKFAPVMLTTVPTLPELVESETMDGAVAIVRVTLLLVCPPDVIVTGPVWAPFGICVVTLFGLHELIEPETPLNDMVPEPPKPEPEIVTVSPMAPISSEMPVMLGAAGPMVKLIVLLPTPPALTCTGPDGAVVGT